MHAELLSFWNSDSERCGIILNTGRVIEIYNAAHEASFTTKSEFAMRSDSVWNAVPEGCSIRGIFHTHPNCSERPSTLDIAGWPVGVPEYYIVTRTSVTEWKLVGSKPILIARAGSTLASPLHPATATG